MNATAENEMRTSDTVIGQLGLAVRGGSIVLLGLCQRHGLAVPRVGDRSYVTGSICCWSLSYLTYATGGC